MLLLALLAQTPPTAVPTAAPAAYADLQQDLQSWFDHSFSPQVRAGWTGAAPEGKIIALDRERWGPDNLTYPRPCGATVDDPAEDGLRQRDIDAARQSLGPDWQAEPTGFTAPGVFGSFRRHPNHNGAPDHFTVEMTRRPADLSFEQLFASGLAHGCSLSKYSDAWMWSGDLLVHVTGPCSESRHFASWTLLVLDALPTWSGAPAPERVVYGSCGTMGLSSRTRTEIEAEERW